MENVWPFVVAHQSAIAGAASAVAGWFVHHIWPSVQAKGEAKVEALVLSPSNPHVKALAIKVDEWIEQAIPAGGDARYAAAAALIANNEPALKPFEPEIAAVLSALGSSLKKATADAAQPKA